MTARLVAQAVVLWRRFRARHEPPWDDEFLSRLNAEVQASLRRSRRMRREGRRQLRKAGESPW